MKNSFLNISRCAFLKDEDGVLGLFVVAGLLVGSTLQLRFWASRPFDSVGRSVKLAGSTDRFRWAPEPNPRADADGAMAQFGIKTETKRPFANLEDVLSSSCSSAKQSAKSSSSDTLESMCTMGEGGPWWLAGKRGEAQLTLWFEPGSTQFEEGNIVLSEG